MKKCKNILLGAAALAAVVLAAVALDMTRADVPTEKMVVQKEQFASNWIVSEVFEVSGNPTTAEGYMGGSEINATSNDSRTLMRSWVYAFKSESYAKEWYDRNVVNLRGDANYTEIDVSKISADCFARYQRLSLAEKTEIACYKDRIGLEIKVVSRDLNSRELAIFFAKRAIANMDGLQY